MGEVKEIKTLVNCNPTEFLEQTYAMKEAAESWLKATDVITIFGRKASLEIIDENKTEEEKAKIAARNIEAARKQMYANINDILKAVMKENAAETVKLLAMCCFIDPDKANDYSMMYYLKAFTSLISDKEVLDFFISLANLGQIDLPDIFKA